MSTDHTTYGSAGCDSVVVLGASSIVVVVVVVVAAAAAVALSWSICLEPFRYSK